MVQEIDFSKQVEWTVNCSKHSAQVTFLYATYLLWQLTERETATSVKFFIQHKETRTAWWPLSVHNWNLKFLDNTERKGNCITSLTWQGFVHWLQRIQLSCQTSEEAWRRVHGKALFHQPWPVLVKVQFIFCLKGSQASRTSFRTYTFVIRGYCNWGIKFS